MPPLNRAFWHRAFKVIDMLKLGKKVTVPILAEKLDTSESAVRRLLDALRDDWHVPMEYDAKAGTWKLTDPKWEPISLDLSPEELASFCLAYSLLDKFPRRFAKAIESFKDKLLIELKGTAEAEAILNHVSIREPSWARVERPVLRAALRALSLGRKLKFRYTSPWKDETTDRVVDPKHLLLYMGNFYLVAHCHLRDDLRLFHLSFVDPRRVRLLDEPVETAPVPIERVLDSYGIIIGPKPITVTVRITGPAARRASVEEWHPEQRDKWSKDGTTLTRTFRVRGTWEVKRLVLGYGADLEVLKPKSFRRAIQDEIQRMAALYEGRAK